MTAELAPDCVLMSDDALVPTATDPTIVFGLAMPVATVVVLVAAQAGEYRDHEATAPWTRPENEFVAPWGMFTTAEFALIARRHMHRYGTTREQLSVVAAIIRNNGSQNPEAVYYQRGPFTTDDITASRPIADPFHLLDCATTSEGGCALVVANVDDIEVASQPIDKARWRFGKQSK